MNSNSTIRAPRPESVGSFQDQKWREGVNGRILNVTETAGGLQTQIDVLDSRLDLLEPAVAANTAAIAAINSSLTGYAKKAVNESITGSWTYASATNVTLPPTVLAPGGATTIRNTVDSQNIFIGGGSAVARANGAGIRLWGNTSLGAGTVQVYAGGQGAQIWGTANWMQLRGCDTDVSGGGTFEATSEAHTAPGSAHIYTGISASSRIRNYLTLSTHTSEYHFGGTLKYWLADNELMHMEDFRIKANTAAGSDNRSITITPCDMSSDPTARAAWLKLAGAQHSDAGKFYLTGRHNSQVQVVSPTGSGVGTLNIVADSIFTGGAVYITNIDGQLKAKSPYFENGFQFASGLNLLSGSDLVIRGKIKIYIDGAAYGMPYCFWP